MINLFDETRDVSHVQEFTAKQKGARRYKPKVVKEGELVLRQVVVFAYTRSHLTEPTNSRSYMDESFPKLRTQSI